MGFFNKLKNAASKAIKEDLLKTIGIEDADEGGMTRDEFEANKRELFSVGGCCGSSPMCRPVIRR